MFATRTIPTALPSLAVLLFAIMIAGAQDPVHQWTFDDPADPGHDYGTEGAHGSVAGNPAFESGITGGTSSLRTFTTRSDKIDVPEALLWTGFSDPAADFSITFWMRRENVDTDADGVFDADPSYSGSIGPGFQFLINATDHPTAPNAFILAVSDGTNRDVDTTNFTIADADSSWHHFALLVSRDDLTGVPSAEVYLDGSSADTLGFPNVTGSIQPGQDLELGTLSNALNFGLEGALDDFRIYSGLLAPATIGKLATVPPAVRFSTFTVTDTDIDFAWETGDGRIYWIEEAPALESWLSVPDSEQSGDGTPASFSLPRTLPRSFYRLRIR